ncbi:MAG TPA: TadE/TadG family type IV pilus assembly protein, partial [Anaerolineae bacterium]|nr:TadE/TadG family type IV pilus assembly protein [Anaerolineae bacterium]
MAKRSNRRPKGQGLVEFALILPLLLLILLGIFEFGRVLFIYSNLF